MQRVAIRAQRALAPVAVAVVLAAAPAPTLPRAEDLASSPADRRDVSLTIYNNDLSLVRERRVVPVRRGVFHLRYEGVTTGIDPTTVHLQARGAGRLGIVEQNYEYDLISRAKLMEKYVGREVGYRLPDGAMGRARLLAANDGGYVYDMGGKIVFELPGTIVLDAVPDELMARPTLVWMLEGDRDGSQEVETAYLSSGLSWRADYVLLLEEDEKRAGLTGWVTLDNRSGASFQNAQLKLVAGEVNRVRDEIRRMKGVSFATNAAMEVRPQFEERGFFEYHLYTLGRRTDVKDNEKKQILFFDAGNVAVDKEYTFRAEPNYFIQGFRLPEGAERVDVTLRFKNSKENGLGVPVPEGILRAYKKDHDGAPQFLGENRVRHTPKDETLEFAVGRAFDIVGEHVQTDFKRLGERVVEMGYEVKLRNHKTEAVNVRVIENFNGDWTIVESSNPHKKENARTASFVIAVKPDAEAVLTYRVRITM